MSTNFTIKEDKVYFKEYLLKKISAEKFEPISYTNQYNQTFIRCLKDKKGIWSFSAIGKGSVKFLTADSDNFSFINDNYARDGKNVFLVAKDSFIIPNSDADSFVVLKNTTFFAKDKNQLYAYSAYSGLSIYRYADCDALFGTGTHQFITDKHNLYHYSLDNGITIVNNHKYIKYLDNNFPFEKQKTHLPIKENKKFLSKYYSKIIGWWHKDYPYQVDFENIPHSGFHKTENAVFYAESNRHLKHYVPTMISNVDHNSFETINEYYGKDHSNVFYKSIPLKNVSVNTFRVIAENFAKDKNNFFFGGNIIDCDFKSFKSIDKDHSFFKDKNTLFSNKTIRPGKIGMRYEIINTVLAIKNSSPMTFRILSKAWAKDENQVYLYTHRYLKADATTFKSLFREGYNDWAKDKNFLYNSNGKRTVKGIDGATFEVLNKFWGKDLNNVFCFHTQRIIPTIDHKTFKITDDKGGAEDENFIFTFNKNEHLKKTKKKNNL